MAKRIPIQSENPGCVLPFPVSPLHAGGQRRAPRSGTQTTTSESRLGLSLLPPLPSRLHREHPCPLKKKPPRQGPPSNSENAPRPFGFVPCRQNRLTDLTLPIELHACMDGPYFSLLYSKIEYVLFAPASDFPQ